MDPWGDEVKREETDRGRRHAKARLAAAKQVESAVAKTDHSAQAAAAPAPRRAGPHPEAPCASWPSSSARSAPA